MLPPAGDILDILYAHSQFSRLVGLLKSISFAEAFQSDDIVTFFAPTNEVISSFDPSLNLSIPDYITLQWLGGVVTK